MKINKCNILPGKLCRRMIGPVILLFIVAITGCEQPLEVDNPNSVLDEDLATPAAATAIANGALVLVSNAASHLLSIYSSVSDEGTWIGSRDGWNQLVKGNVGDHNNEFTDDAWLWVTEARWMSDKAIAQLTEFDNADELEDRSDLARSYLYAGLVRIMIADVFDDFVFSDKTEPSPAIGEDNMVNLYDEAVAKLDAALTIANDIGDAELPARIIALRARAKNAKAIWGKVNPRGTANTADPYVDAGRDDAEMVLGMVADDWRWQLDYSTVAEVGDAYPGNAYSFWVNTRLELDVVDAVNDPIDNIPDPRIARIVAEFKDVEANGGADYARFTVVTAQEMRLIIAESDVARGNIDDARAKLNDLRARDNLSAITNEDVGMMLQH